MEDDDPIRAEAAALLQAGLHNELFSFLQGVLEDTNAETYLVDELFPWFVHRGQPVHARTVVTLMRDNLTRTDALAQLYEEFEDERDLYAVKELFHSLQGDIREPNEAIAFMSLRIYRATREREYLDTAIELAEDLRAVGCYAESANVMMHAGHAEPSADFFVQAAQLVSAVANDSDRQDLWQTCGDYLDAIEDPARPEFARLIGNSLAKPYAKEFFRALSSPLRILTWEFVMRHGNA